MKMLLLLVAVQATIDSVIQEVEDRNKRVVLSHPSGKPANIPAWEVYTVENSTDEYVKYQLDMIIKKDKLKSLLARKKHGRRIPRKADEDDSDLWPNDIPFMIDDTFNDTQKYNISQAINKVMRYTCVVFGEMVKMKREPFYIKFKRASAGSSAHEVYKGVAEGATLTEKPNNSRQVLYLYEKLRAENRRTKDAPTTMTEHTHASEMEIKYIMHTKKQFVNEWTVGLLGVGGNGECNSVVGLTELREHAINLADECLRVEIVAHEILHALGLYHEHMRHDRDNHVTIHFENITDGWSTQFEQMEIGKYRTFNTPYDYLSLMHYGKDSYGTEYNSTNRKITIEPKQPQYLDVIGNAPGLSFYDIKILNSMYKCAAGCEKKTCPGDTQFQGKTCECYCQGPPDDAAVLCDRPPESCYLEDGSVTENHIVFQSKEKLNVTDNPPVRSGATIEIRNLDPMICGFHTLEATCNNGTWDRNLALPCIQERCQLGPTWNNTYWMVNYQGLSLNTTGLPHNTDLYMECLSDDNINTTLQCDKGKWKDQMQPCPGDCDNPDKDKVLNGIVIFDSNDIGVTEHGESIGIVCARGFEIAEGESYRSVYCDHGVWIDLPSECIPNDCQLPNSIRGMQLEMFPRTQPPRYLSGFQKIDHSTTILVNCTNGGTEPNNRKFKCEAAHWYDDEDEWDAKTHAKNWTKGAFPECRGAVCNPPCENGGTCIRDNKCRCLTGTEGKLCDRYTCPKLCTDNGGVCNMSNTCTCPNNRYGSYCDILLSEKCKKQLLNGRVEEVAGRISITCDRGYKLTTPQHDNVFMCEYDVLMTKRHKRIPTCTPIGCSAPNVDAEIPDDVVKEMYGPREAIRKFICRAGYRQILGSSIVCQAGGTWHGKAPCERIRMTKYRIRVKTWHAGGAGTDADIYIKLIGQGGNSGEIQLTHEMDHHSNMFDSGITDVFEEELNDVGELRAINIRISFTNSKGDHWLPQVFTIYDFTRERYYRFKNKRWMDRDGSTYTLQLDKDNSHRRRCHEFVSEPWMYAPYMISNTSARDKIGCNLKCVESHDCYGAIYKDEEHKCYRIDKRGFARLEIRFNAVENTDVVHLSKFCAN